MKFFRRQPRDAPRLDCAPVTVNGQSHSRRAIQPPAVQAQVLLVRRRPAVARVDVFPEETARRIVADSRSQIAASLRLPRRRVAHRRLDTRVRLAI